MGIVTEVKTLEEMCDLMCDNKLPEEKTYPYCGNCDYFVGFTDADALGDEYGICEADMAETVIRDGWCAKWTERSQERSTRS